ncbi:MAG: DEAD/DEAH box helicase family protein [Actinobacteria bacterium]|nr:DEAD/DEAH box helicase family protein [Actinomycetota bacterium]
MTDTATALLNPILNGPYDPPAAHFAIGPDGPTGEKKPGRRPSESFMAIPQERKGRGKASVQQLEIDFDLTGERREVNDTINGLRRDVELWRTRGYDGVTPISRKLLLHWADTDRENRTLFCQRDAAETAIFLTEVAGRRGYTDWRLRIDAANEEHNSGLPRIALKMATGTGKTVLMAMLIAWQTLNKVAAPRDTRFASKFLLVAPGITIRDRLRVLRPESDGNYYDERELVPADLRPRLGDARVVIANYHQFLPRLRKEFEGVSKTTREILAPGDGDRYVETAAEIVSRVLRDLGKDPGQIIVLNDEAHHCYQSRPLRMGKVSKDDSDRNKDARVWFRGLEAIRTTKGYGLKQVFDVSATPFYLGGSGWNEGYIFPWTVSDFSLMDAIESGIVKIPRLPIDDDAIGDETTFRALWSHVGDRLPKRLSSVPENWAPPEELQAALESLYRSYQREYERWNVTLRDHDEPPPVMILVCPNTVVSRLMTEWIAGREIEVDGETHYRHGRLELFDNTDGVGWRARPRTLLIDSAALESGESLPKDFLAAAGPEIARFKDDWRKQHPGADADQLTEQDLLREVMNTVGKKGMLGEHIRCVVSVGMLTEGWDANTVTHILGIRAFGSQLLCEQVIGRGLRRRSWALNEEGRFEPEYANVYGIPFAFIPGERAGKDPLPPPPAVEVGSVEGREGRRITFPRLSGYRVEMPDDELWLDTSDAEPFRVDQSQVPTKTETAGVLGEGELDDFNTDAEGRRNARVAFELAKRVLDLHFTDGGTNPRPWLFPRLLGFARTWIDEVLEFGEGFEAWHLTRSENELRRAAEALARCIVWQGNNRRELVQPIFDRSAPVGDTGDVHFVTRKRVYETKTSEISHVTLDGRDGNTWENLLAYECEMLANEGVVTSYVKNDRLGFDIPYVHEGMTHRYIPDFLLKLAPDPGDPEGLDRTLVVEVSGGRKNQQLRAVKAETARNVWCVAVNNHGGFGRWGYLELDTVIGLQRTLREAINGLYADDPIIGDWDNLSFSPARSTRPTRRVRFLEDDDGA